MRASAAFHPNTWSLRRGLIAVLALAVLLPVPAAADSAYDRIYLLADEGQFLYWSFRTAEDGVDQATSVRRCSGGGNVSPTPCYMGTNDDNGRYYQFSFNPLSRALGNVAWSSQAPLRFHLELDVDGATPSAVQLITFNGSSLLTSDPAQLVAPGVYEGELNKAGSFGLTKNAQFSVRVSFSDPWPTQMPPVITLKTAGASYLDLPAPVPGRSLADMRAAAPPATDPSTYRTGLRTFLFNDRDWEAHEFTGDLSETAEFTVTLDRRAVGVMGVVEMFGAPALHSAVRRGEVSPEMITDAPVTALMRNGVQLQAGANSRTEQAGRGSDTVAATDVGAGTLTLRVSSAQFSTDLAAAGEDNGYRAWLVVMYGPRTLAGYRSSYMPRHSVQTPTVRIPGGGACSHFSELLPVSSAATAARASISWDAIQPAQQWTHTFGVPGIAYYPCGEAGTGTTITSALTPASRILPFGATMVMSSAGASHRDVVIHERVDLTYNP